MAKIYAMALPVVAGKMEQWQAFQASLKTERKRDYEASRQKAGVKREMIWHQPSPAGDVLLLVLEIEGDFADFARLLSQPENEFEKWFVAQAQEIHGITAEQFAELKAPEQIFDWTCPSVFERASETALGIGHQLSETAQGIFEKASQTAGEMSKAMAENAGGVTAKAQSMAQEAGERMQKQAQEAGERMQKQAQEAGERMQKQAQEVKKQVELKASELMHQTSENVAELTQQMQSKASEALENASEVSHAVVEKATGLFNQALGMLQRKGNEPETDKDSSSKA